jgi:hypothetical protein
MCRVVMSFFDLLYILNRYVLEPIVENGVRYILSLEKTKSHCARNGFKINPAGLKQL